MSTDRIWQEVTDKVCESFALRGVFFVPVASSNRHVHLSQYDVETLFGKGYTLTKLRDLKQPGQFACREQVTLSTDKGSILLRVVGPVRNETQAELSVSECVKLGLPSVVRMSGDLNDTPSAMLQGEKGSIRIKRGVIVSARHLHLSDAQAKLYRLKNGDKIKLFVEGERACVLENVIVRCGEGHILEAHIDIEEWNAAGMHDHSVCRIEKQGDSNLHYVGERMFLEKRADKIHGNIIPAAEAPVYATSGLVRDSIGKRDAMPEPAKKKLLTESDIFAVQAQGKTSISTVGCVVTPLARDRAMRLGITIED